MRYETGPLLDPEAYANPVVDETGTPVAEQPTTLTGDADRGIGLDPYADLRPNQSDLAPDFIRQIPNVAIDMDRRKREADEFLSRGRQAIADKWLEIAQTDLQARAQEALASAGTALTGAAETFLAPPSPEQVAELEALTETRRQFTDPMRVLNATQEGIDTARRGIDTFNPFGLTAEEQAQRPALGGPFALRGDIAGGAQGLVLPIGLGPAGKWKPGVDPVLDAFNLPPTKQPGGGLMLRLEELLSDRYAAGNKVGQQTEELIANYGGRTEGAFWRAAEELGPVYAQIADDLPVLNKWVGLQTYLENAAAKLNPTRKGVGGIASVPDALAQVAKMEADLGPELMAKIRAADDLRVQIMRGVLEDKVNAGLVPRPLADFLNEHIPHYNPTVITRFVEEAGMGQGGRTLKQMISTLKRLTPEGSELEQLPPMQAALRHVMDSDLAIRRNRLLNTLVEEGGFKAKPAIRLTTGMSTESGELETVVSRGVHDPRGKALFMRDGKPWEAEVSEDIAKMLDRMSTEHLRAADVLAMNMNRSLRVGATALNPSFLAANATRDYIASFMREGLLPTEYAAGLAQALAKGPLYRQYMRAGGGMGEAGRAGSLYRGHGLSKNIADLEKEVQSAGGAMLSTPRDLSQFVRAIERRDPVAMAKYFTDISRIIPITDIGEAIELAPRLATFGKHLGRGETVEKATTAGRRVSVDFNRAGELTRVLNYYTPFLNARIQGGLTTARSLRDNPQSRMRAGLLAGAAAATYFYNRQFGDRFTDVPDYLRENGFGVVMLPFGEEKKADGPGYEKNPYLTIPLGEWGAIATGVEETLRAIDGTNKNLMDAIGNIVNAGNPLPGGEGLTSTVLGVAPVTAPVKALIEQQANYDFFRHRPIESESMQNLLPELRYGPRTPEAAKRIADSLADKPFVPEWLKSPARIEHLVGASTGGAGRMALQGASTLMGQESDRTPVAGGLFSTVYRTYGGAIEQRTYEERDAVLRELQQQYRPMIRAIEENTGSGSITSVPKEIAGGIPLQPADQSVYQRARLATLQEILVGEPGLDEELAQLTPTERKSVFSSFIKAANQVAAAITVEQIAEDELVRRVEQKQEPNKRRSLPKEEYTPVVGR